MGEAYDRTGAFLGSAEADSAREVLEKLQLKHMDAAEFRIRQHVHADQMVDVYGVPCDVQSVRKFKDGRQLGAGYALRDPATWFVYDREPGREGNGVWHKHCGPYGTFDVAKDWINDIRED